MKQRQEVPRTLAITVLAIIATMLLIIIFTPMAKAQTRKLTGKEYHMKLQKENSWDNYQSTYKKSMLSNAKDARKAKKDKAKRKHERFLARIERIKQ